MIVVQNLPSMIGNRKTNSPDFPVANSEDSFGSQDMSNLTLRDRTKICLSLNDLEPRKPQNFSSFVEFPSQLKPTDEAPQSTPTPTQILFPKNVTEEQEAYVRGFSQALEEIYRQHGPPASSVAKYVETTQHLEEKRTDPHTTSGYGQTWFYNDSKSSVFSVSQIDQKPNFSQLNSNAYEPPFVPLSSYPTMVEDTWQNAQSSVHSNYSNVGQMFASSSNDDFVVGSLPSTSFSSAGQKRNLSKMASQSLGSLTPSSLGSPCGSDVAVHSRAVGGEFATLDMEEQEKLRLERKRAKNRLAAQKCQLKKVERIKQLESRVNFLKDKNSCLSAKAATLRRDIDKLKAAINVHVSRGCRILSSSAYNSCDVVPPFT